MSFGVVLDNELMAEEISSFVYNMCSLMNFPRVVINSVLFFLRKINNHLEKPLMTYSVKSLLGAMVLATRAQKYVISYNELADFFFEHTGLICTRKALRRYVKRYELLERCVSQCKDNCDLERLSRIKSGNFKLKELGDRDQCL